MIDNNTQTHDETQNSPGYTGATPCDRIENVFPNLVNCGENIAGYVPSLNFINAFFLVDWGVTDLGHRINIMSLPSDGENYSKFNQIGIGLVANKTQTSSYITTAAVTEDFALDNRVFVTGVVYQDPNHVGFYTQGHGLAGVTIRPSVGSSYAVTSSSGGYAIPIDPSLINSSFTITASGPSIGADITKSISMNGNNVKVDFVPDEMATPITLSTQAPANGTPNEIFVTRTFNLQSVLNVKYKMSGDAINGVDYKMLTGLLQFPAGVSTMTLKITPKLTKPNVKKTVVLEVKNGPLNEGGMKASVVIGG